MQVFKTAGQLKAHLDSLKKSDSSVTFGFVPTMGALHDGHLTLIHAAASQCQYVICSIFVNPTQFNDPKDLERYPRTLDQDEALLSENGCNIIYVPEVADVYPNGLNEPYQIDFQGLDLIMEGQFRPGHFKGVAQVVERLFAIVEPDIAFFGRKDFQQVAIIKHLVSTKNLPVRVVVVDTVRNTSGLALSSRNALLDDQQKKDALIIYKTLLLANELAKNETSASVIKSKLIDFFNAGNLKLEYLEIADDTNLLPVDSITLNCTCCIAAWCGNVRLIDNMPIRKSQ